MVNDGNNMHGSQVSLLTSRYRLVVASDGKWWQVTELYFILTISLETCSSCTCAQSWLVLLSSENL